MISPSFKIGDEVEIIGPTRNGADMCCGQKITIAELDVTKDATYYSDEHLPWYPADSLRLVEELKIGDWVQVIGDPNGLLDKCDLGKILLICSITDQGNFNLIDACYIYDRSALRKLTPEEVQAHLRLVPPANTPQNQWIERTEDRLAAIEENHRELKAKQGDQKARIDAIMSRQGTEWDEMDKRQDDLDYAIKTMGQSIGKMQKSISCLEAYQRGEMPEAMPDCKPKFWITICNGMSVGDGRQGASFTCPADALNWCEKVLNDMRSGKP